MTTCSLVRLCIIASLVTSSCRREISPEDSVLREVEKFVAAQKDISKQLETADNPDKVVKAIDALAASAIQLKNMPDAPGPKAGTKGYDEGTIATETFNLNATAAANAVEKFNTSPRVLAAWQRLQTAIQQLLASSKRER